MPQDRSVRVGRIDDTIRGLRGSFDTLTKGNADLERLYGRLEDEYELIERAETLDRKLGFISATASALVELQDADRSLRLELVIVALIVAELALALGQLFGLGR